jgi:uncharacterized protein YecE (DUF72 family)
LRGSAYVGASGFSYPTWKPGFYPADAKPPDFLRRYAERLPAVELNTTGYRLPAESAFERWAEQTPPAFRFAVKMQGFRLQQIGEFDRRTRLLGERFGVVRVAVMQPRDEGWLALLLGSLDPQTPVALDLRHESWADADIGRAVRVDDWDADAPFRYLRFRDPPYPDEELSALAGRIQPFLDDGADVYAFFRHEDEPTAPRYAEKLLELLA